MQQVSIKNIIFDLDGTLVNSAGDILFCLKNAYSVLPNLGQINIDQSVIGPPLGDLIKKISPDLNLEDTSLVIKRFRECYDNSNFSRTCLNDGVSDFLKNIKKIGINRFIATNKPNFVTKKILKRLMIDDFDDIVTLDIISGKKLNKAEMISYIMTKWNLVPDATLVIGDDASDVFAARLNGLNAVAVTTGYGNRTEIEKAGPIFIADKIEKLYPVLKWKLHK